MKKSVYLKIILSVILLTCIFTFAVSCSMEKKEEVTAKSIEILTLHDGAYYIGDDVDLSEVTFRVHYTDKSTKDFTLDDTMLSDADSGKFFIAGTHTVSILCEGTEGHFQINVIDVAKEGKFLAKFYSLGGTEVSSIADTKVKAFPKPEREGYTFDGWYTDIRYVQIAGVNTVEYMGSKVREPYELSANTSFYAKWIDDRICTVTFVDSDNTVLNYKKENETDEDVPMIVQIHYGEKINIDNYIYPIDKVEGKTFVGWEVINGNPDRVTADIKVRAKFTIDRCTIRIEYENNSGKIIAVESVYDYGEEIYIGAYRKPTREGYISNWVVYENYSETYEKLPENQIVVLTEPYVKVCANFQIIVYNINIMNGKTVQTKNNLKSGNIELDKAYDGFTAEWDGDFDFADYTQEPNISAPAVLYDENGISGYNGQWCFVVTDKSGNQIWYNTSGHIWNDEKCIFEPQEWQENEGENNWTLYNADGEYIAKVENKILSHIKGEVNVRAKYIKKTYDVNLYRFVGEMQIKLATFKVRYLSDFDLYDSAFYNPGTAVDTASYEFTTDWNGGALIEKSKLPEYDPTIVRTPSELVPDPDRFAIEQFYLIENTDHVIKSFASAYYVTNVFGDTNAEEDDWSITWFTDAKCTNMVDFARKVEVEENETPLPKVVEVGDNVNLYCVDTDNRQYEVAFRYAFSFEDDGTGNFVGYSGYKSEFHKENEVLIPPTVPNITYTIPSSEVLLTYEFEGWFLTPFDSYLKSGYRGEQQSSFLSRKKSVTYYAHYYCTQGVTIKIYDVTQSATYLTSGFTDSEGRKYSGATYVPGEPEDTSYSYTVAEDTITYKLEKGDIFDLDSMVYKGIKLNDNSTISGQTYFDNQKRYDFYREHYVGLGGIKQYLINDRKFDISTLKQLNRALNAILEDNLNALDTVYSHNYVYETEEYEFYLKYFGRVGLQQDGNYATVLINEQLLNDLRCIYDAIVGKIGNYNEAQISTLFAKLGNYEEFITHYLTVINELYEADFSKNQTGLSGITRFEDKTFGEKFDTENMSWKDVISMLEFITEEYITFLENEGIYFEKYSKEVEMPMYKTSYRDINDAFGYNIDKYEEKYSFSGWFTDVAYTKPVQLDLNPLKFIAENDITLYAKWTDVTKGTEGLVYEEVLVNDGATEFNAYVLVDFANSDEYTSNYPQSGIGTEYYYITKNDTGAIPASISTPQYPIDIKLQIPASIEKYLDKTLEAKAYYEAGDWLEYYKNFMVYDKSLYTYVPANSVFNERTTYYVKETYPVIGVQSDALVRYAKYIVSVEIPLNIYFIEEGAFRNCPVNIYSRKLAKESEVAENYVIIDSDFTISDSVVIYQNEAMPYVEVKGKYSDKLYKGTQPNTLIGYAVNYSINDENYTGVEKVTYDGIDYTKFNIPESIERIGDYAFGYSRNLKWLNGIEKIKSIGNYAFIGGAVLSGIGESVDKFTIYNDLVSIGKSAFRSCINVSDITVLDGSKLSFVGKEAFLESDWYMKKSAKGVIVLDFIDENDKETGILIDFSSVASYQGFDSDEAGDLIKYNENGDVDVNGIYNGIKTEFATVLYKVNSSSRTARVLITFDVKLITEYAFYEKEVETIVVKSVAKIGDNSFGNANKLVTIEIQNISPDGKTTLFEDVFYGRDENSKVRIKFTNATVYNGVINESWTQYSDVIELIY